MRYVPNANRNSDMLFLEMHVLVIEASRYLLSCLHLSLNIYSELVCNDCFSSHLIPLNVSSTNVLLISSLGKFVQK